MPRVLPLETANAVIAARRFYFDGATKSEIAYELGVSRFKVARLLDVARRNGIVRIEIDSVPEVDPVLSRELALAYGIRGAIVVNLADGPEEFQRSQLGIAAAVALADSLEESDVLGISWGRTLHAMVGHLPRLPTCPVVQLVGSVPTLELDVNSLELVRRVAEQTHGPIFALHVPLILDSARTAGLLRRDPHVARTLAMFPRVTRAIVGVGAWTREGSTVHASLSETDARIMDLAGAVADVSSIVLDPDGREVRGVGLPGRCIAISVDQLRTIPDVVAVAGGIRKVDALRAALRSGLVHRLVTTDQTARLLV